MTQQLTELELKLHENQPLPDNVDDMELLLAEDGFDLSNPKLADELDKRIGPIVSEMEEAKAKSRERPQSLQQNANRAFNWRDSSAVLSGGILMGWLPPVGLVALFLTEFISVGIGLNSFMGTTLLKSVTAWVTAFTLMVIYFVVEWARAELVYNYPERKIYKRTFGLFIRRFWQTVNPLEKPVARDEDSEIVAIAAPIWWMRFLIVVIGTLGRADEKFDSLSGVSWYQGFANIAVESNISEFLEYLGAGLTAGVLLIATMWVIHMLHRRWKEVGITDETFFDSSAEADFHAEIQKVTLQYMQHLARTRYARKRSRVEEKYEAMQLEPSNQTSVDLVLDVSQADQ